MSAPLLRTWQEFMKNKGREPRLHLIENETGVRSLLLDFMACRLFSFNNHQSILGGVSPL